MITVNFIEDKNTKKAVSRKILTALPDWFGIPESTEEYIEKSAGMPFWTADANNEAIGFAVLKQTSQSAAEVYVMGVLTQYHKMGAGRALIHKCESFCRENKLSLLHVKTLDKSHPDTFYAETRAFYTAMGFKELECITEIWGKSCPCLIMVKHLDIRH